MEKKLKITTGKQFQTLVAELEKNPNLVRGFHAGSSLHNSKHDWDEITIKLNANGPPIRDTDGWLKVWRDFKFKVKKKFLQREAEMNSNDSEKTKRVILHPLEEAVANMLQFQPQSNGNVGAVSEMQSAAEEMKADNLEEIKAENVKEIKAENEIKLENMNEIKTEMVEQNIWEEEEGLLSGNQSAMDEIKMESYYILDQTFLGDEDLPSTSGNSLRMQNLTTTDRKKRKRSRKTDVRQELLEKHNAMQEKVFNEISNTLIQIKNILKDSSRYHQKLFEVEEKKLKLMEQRHEREEQLIEKEMKLKIIEMKIKSKELEALEKQSSL